MCLHILGCRTEDLSIGSLRLVAWFGLIRIYLRKYFRRVMATLLRRSTMVVGEMRPPPHV